MSVKLFEPIGNYFIKQVERDIKYAVISAKQFICTGYACVQPTYDMNGNTISVKVSHNGKWILNITKDQVQVTLHKNWDFMYQSKSLYNIILKSINSNLRINDSYEFVDETNLKVDDKKNHSLNQPMIWDCFQYFDSNCLEEAIIKGKSYNFIGFGTIQPFIRPNGELICIKVALKGQWILQINGKCVKVLSYTDEYMKENRIIINKLLKKLKSNLYCNKKSQLYNVKVNKRVNTDNWYTLDEDLYWSLHSLSLSDYFISSTKIDDRLNKILYGYKV